jgi:tryptophan synthase alpha chain
MNRIEQRFANLKAVGQKGFVAYIGAGDPDLEHTRQLALALDGAGVDVLELGVPFSDPLADGLVNQLAAQRGLASGTTPPALLKTVADIRRDSQVPIVLYIYFNLMHQHGLKKFMNDAKASGVDGMLTLDLPPEEADEYAQLMHETELCSIWLVAPTTPEERVKSIVRNGSGFIYYISREGVTGMQQNVAVSIKDKTSVIRQHTKLPIAVGFGISSPDQARQVADCADAVVVGSAIVNQIAEHGAGNNLAGHVADYVKTLVDAVKPPIS